MNAIQFLSTQPGVQRLGSTLLHFLWEGAMIAFLYAVARKVARASGPNVRYILACATLAAMAAAPMLTWSLLRPRAPETVAASFIEPLSADAPTIARSIPVSFSGGTSQAAPASYLPWVVSLWLAGA